MLRQGVSNTFGDMTQFGSNNSLDDVAYKNPDGSKALVVVNNAAVERCISHKEAHYLSHTSHFSTAKRVSYLQIIRAEGTPLFHKNNWFSLRRNYASVVISSFI